MATYSQQGRLLEIQSVLGDDVLLLAGLSGREELSRLFRFRLDLLSEDETIAPKDLVGTAIGWSVNQVDSAPRHFHGFVSRLVAGGRGARGLRAYRAEVVPWLWFLTRTADCRIFQNKTTPEIVKAVFDDHGFSDYTLNLSGSYAPREYCVQYRESAFDFVSRLMEEEGIFYSFRHEAGKHTLALANATAAYQTCVEDRVAFSGGSLSPNHVSAWEHRYEYRSGRWTHNDYNFETPSTSLLASTDTVVQLPALDHYELFDYPGVYGRKADGESAAKVRIEEQEVAYDVVEGTSACCSFTPGSKFTLTDHEIEAEQGGYLLTAVEHSARDTSYTNEAVGSSYANTFTCIPDSVVFRPARLTPRPTVRGPQTAVVVGPAGEEIYTDKYGRVKVQFFWDRQGRKDENSSCWIRVAESWAGKNWGVIFNPRIGQEVVVDFLEGNPDRPLITGRVYNAEQMPPYALPANQTQSTLKSRSSRGGGPDDFNELRFEDKKGSEEVYLHAQKDFNRVVENNDTLKVGSSDGQHCLDGSQTVSIWKDRTTTIETGDETLTVKTGNRAMTIKQDETLTVQQGNRATTVETGNDTHEIKMGNREVTIDMGNDTLTIKMGNQTTKLNLGASSTEALQSITLKVGQSSITVDQMGVTIKGMMVKVEGQVQTSVKGLMTQVAGDGMLQASGGIIMIG